MKLSSFALSTCLAAALLAPPLSSQGWVRKSPPTSPEPRLAAAMAFDSERRLVVLFGGHSGAAVLGDTWTWDGLTWRQRFPSNSPSPRHAHSLAFDPIRREIVLYGGYSSSGAPLWDTWTWEGGNWTLHSQYGPQWNTPVALTTDTSNQAVRLWGGDTGFVWTWNKPQWIPINSTPGPSWRRGHAVSWDPATRSLLAFGGNVTLNDTWLWNPATYLWTLASPPISPPGRYVHSLAVDPGTSKVLLFGGHNYTLPEPDQFFNDTWLWNGATWEPQPSPDRPPGRWKAMLAADTARGELVLFGGQGPLAGPAHTIYGDTWVWRSAVPDPSVSLTASPTTTVTGTGVTFVAEVANPGPGDATAVNARFTSPPALGPPSSAFLTPPPTGSQTACASAQCDTIFPTLAHDTAVRIAHTAHAGCQLPGGVPLNASISLTAAADSSTANNSAAAMAVTVNPPPTVIAPAALALATGPAATLCGVTLASPGAALVTDNCPGWSLAVTGVPNGAFYPVGETVLTHTAVDSGGASASALQAVRVRDATPPAVSPLTVDKPVLWPANHKMVLVTVSYPGTDNCRTASCQLTATSNEPPNATGDGNTNSDITIVDARRLWLRAERSGNLRDRVYTITISCTDSSANAARNSVTVTVPHNQ